MGELIVGPWIGFEDSKGVGICQPDLLVVGTYSTLILEAKLKQSKRALVQLQHLYAPLAEKVWGQGCVCIQVFKWPSCDKTTQWVNNPQEALDSRKAFVHYWHYIP